jgi:dTDP-4-dehydrorhamnose reductase
LAQDAAAQFVGWKDWMDMENVTTTHARHLIAMQQDLDKRVKKNGYKNDVIYNATAYFNLLKAQNIPYENAQAVYQQLKENLIKAK